MDSYADKKEAVIADKLDEVMSLLGITRTDSNADTPKRIAKMWCREVFANRHMSNDEEFISSLKVFENTENYEGNMVVVKDIPFNSMCEHHFMPFFGTVSVGYVPDKKIIGLSKIPRIVTYYSKMPQLQERFTRQVLDCLFKVTNPMFAVIQIKAKHTCVSCRGIELPSETVTRTALCATGLDEEEFDWCQALFDKQCER